MPWKPGFSAFRWAVRPWGSHRTTLFHHHQWHRESDSSPLPGWLGGGVESVNVWDSSESL